jgi:hypothetical protein
MLLGGPIETLLSAFPGNLLLTLLAISWLVKLAEQNGCIAQMAGFVGRRLALRLRAVPVLGFLAAAALSALGLGNIAATALLAPPLLTLAQGIGLSPFLMTLLIVGGANAPVLSPYSLTGLIIRHAVARYPQAAAEAASGPWAFFLSFAALSFVHGLGFWILGGRRWWKGIGVRRAAGLTARVELAPLPSWSKAQTQMGLILALFVVLTGALGSAGWAAALGLGLAAIWRLGDIKLAFRQVPWSLLALIGAVSMGIGVVERELGFGFVTRMAERAASPLLVLTWLSLATSLLSVFTSSSGVVLPLMLPLLPTFALVHPSLSVEGLVVAVTVSSHLVDCSPFSSLGALCIASVSHEQESAQLFRQLLRWGFAMILGALLLCLLGRWIIEPLIFL